MSIVTPIQPSEPLQRLSAADLLALPDEERYELVDGQLHELHVGYIASRIGVKLIFLLEAYCRQLKLGHVLNNDCGYQCFPDDPDKVRKPDVSFIRAERVALIDLTRGYCQIAPDLAVEVISPNDTMYEVSRKIEDYRNAGVRLIWILDPILRLAHVHRAAGTPTVVTLGEELTGEDVLPGFRCQLSELFDVEVTPA